jgi:hypothetical protein
LLEALLWQKMAVMLAGVVPWGNSPKPLGCAITSIALANGAGFFVTIPL